MANKPNQNIAVSALEIKKIREKIDELAFENNQGKVKDVHQIRKLRKQIARLLTKIHQESYKNA